MSPLIIIFLTVFIDLLGFGIIIPLLPFYAESYGANAFTVGLLGTVYSLMQFLFAPIWGRLSDRIGRRPIILLGLLGRALPYWSLALADSLALIFAARIVGGIAGAQHPDRAGLHRRHDDARESGKGHGDGRRGIRARLHLRARRSAAC